MSFSTDIMYIMNNDASINSYVDGDILYENLPENFELTKNWIVYSFNKTNQFSCLGSNAAITEYNLIIKVVATDTLELETISDRLVAYLNGNEYNQIRDLVFVGDNHTLDLDKKVYMNTLNFNCLYS